MQENDELTSRVVRNELLDKWPELSVSIRTVRRARWGLGWRSTCPKYCQLVREVNKQKRLEWCKERTISLIMLYSQMSALCSWIDMAMSASEKKMSQKR